MDPIVFCPIGIIHSPHKRSEEIPIQPVYAGGIQGRAELFPKYADGLQDLNGFSHVYLIYHFHKTTTSRLIVTPFLDDSPRGVFATRAPCRPNAIGLSLVHLLRIDGCTLYLEDIDILDDTPLLDIKPYVARFDSRADARCGWTEEVDEATASKRGLRRHGRACGDA